MQTCMLHATDCIRICISLMGAFFDVCKPVCVTRPSAYAYAFPWWAPFSTYANPYASRDRVQVHQIRGAAQRCCACERDLRAVRSRAIPRMRPRMGHMRTRLRAHADMCVPYVTAHWSMRTRMRARRYVDAHRTFAAYMHYAKWEERGGQRARSRTVFERASEELPETERDERLYIEFARFESRAKEYERARAIFKFALDHVPKHLAKDLFTEFVTFEKQHGETSGIEEVIVSKRRFQYEEAVKASPLNYDLWFDYIRLEECAGDAERIRDVYVRAHGHGTFPCGRPIRHMRIPVRAGTSARSRTCLPWRRSATGGATCTCGSTTPCSRSWRRRTLAARARSTGWR